jgi:hypothetical protein
MTRSATTTVGIISSTCSSKGAADSCRSTAPRRSGCNDDTSPPTCTYCIADTSKTLLMARISSSFSTAVCCRGAAPCGLPPSEGDPCRHSLLLRMRREAQTDPRCGYGDLRGAKAGMVGDSPFYSTRPTALGRPQANLGQNPSARRIRIRRPLLSQGRRAF